MVVLYFLVSTVRFHRLVVVCLTLRVGSSIPWHLISTNRMTNLRNPIDFPSLSLFYCRRWFLRSSISPFLSTSYRSSSHLPLFHKELDNPVKIKHVLSHQKNPRVARKDCNTQTRDRTSTVRSDPRIRSISRFESRGSSGRRIDVVLEARTSALVRKTVLRQTFTPLFRRLGNRFLAHLNRSSSVSVNETFNLFALEATHS